MQEDFHYYATYCAAFLAGYSHEVSLAIAYSDQFTDCCTRTFLEAVHGPASAATTQLSSELAEAKTDILGMQDITRIWASFHFLPYDLYANLKGRTKAYMRKYRLICAPNSDLAEETVRLAENGNPQAVGVAMHVIADTWAHRYFAGTPSLVINNTDHHFYELLPADGASSGGDLKYREQQIIFRHSTSKPDDPEKCVYTQSISRSTENSIMNLGHGRAGHLPDYSFVRYKYLPAWGDYEEIVKDNPSDYYHAFTQMLYALKTLRSGASHFEKDRYDTETAAPWESRIRSILEKRQLSASKDWKSFGEELSGCEIEAFDRNKYQAEYMNAPEEQKADTFLGKYFLAAMAQKSMVTNRIYKSGSMLAGYSVEYQDSGFRGIRDYSMLLNYFGKERGDE
ncbi:MAG: DUF6765 family protein [Eubacterium sp.]|nr:DUF6765 family protein [Eubacterium sp.]